MRLSRKRLDPKCCTPQKSILQGRNTLDYHQLPKKKLGLNQDFSEGPLDNNLRRATDHATGLNQTAAPIHGLADFLSKFFK